MGGHERQKSQGGSRTAWARGKSATALLLVAALVMAGCNDSNRKRRAAAEPAIPPALEELNLVEFHSTFTESQNDLCVTCHGTMLDRRSLDPANPEFHKFKLDPTNGILPDWKCTDCHERVDLVSRAGGNLRKQVNVETICYPCHLANGIGTRLYVK